MYINRVLEFTVTLDNDKFLKALSRAYKKSDYLEKDGEKYTDHTLSGKGITVMYRDSQYKKKVKVVANSRLVLDCDKPDPDKFIRKLNKRIGEYFDFKYVLDDFILSGMIFSMDINVRSREKVSAYLKVLKRIGRVKGFSPSCYDCLDDIDSFCLKGNSNGIDFLIYDLEEMCRKQTGTTDVSRKKLKEMIEESEGILRAEVRLAKPKAIRVYTDAANIFEQMEELSEKCQDIFLDVFTRVIPFGNYYKKDRAVEIIRNEIKDSTLRRKMLRLVALIPEKKSLHLAQKSLNCRNIEKIMDTFAKINLSPVTISKRHDIKYLKNLYACVFGES